MLQVLQDILTAISFKFQTYKNSNTVMYTNYVLFKLEDLLFCKLLGPNNIAAKVLYSVVFVIQCIVMREKIAIFVL